MGTLEGLLEALSTCIRCYNCRDACPICYCKECIFDAEFMKPTARGMLRKAGKKGLLRMPQDTLLFHITRLNHMVSSCVRCGMCEEVDGPADGDVIVVTGEPVLRALLAGRIAWDAAVASRLVIVDGPPGASERLARTLARRFS